MFIAYTLTYINVTLFFNIYIKSKMPILNFIGEIYLNQKKPNLKYFFEVLIRLHEGGDRMEF